MPAHHAIFRRRYRAALLDYLLSGTDRDFERAHDLGREAVVDGLGLLFVLRTHQHEVSALFGSVPNSDRGLRWLNGSHTFLMEALSIFEMTHRGYVGLIGRTRPADVVRASRRRRTRTGTRAAANPGAPVPSSPDKT